MIALVLTALAQPTPPDAVSFTLDWSCSMFDRVQRPPVLVRGTVAAVTPAEGGTCRHRASVSAARRGTTAIEGLQSIRWTGPCGPSVGDPVRGALKKASDKPVALLHVGSAPQVPWNDLARWLAAREDLVRAKTLAVKGATDAL